MLPALGLMHKDAAAQIKEAQAEVARCTKMHAGLSKDFKAMETQRTGLSKASAAAGDQRKRAMKLLRDLETEEMHFTAEADHDAAAEHLNELRHQLKDDEAALEDATRRAAAAAKECVPPYAILRASRVEAISCAHFSRGMHEAWPLTGWPSAAVRYAAQEAKLAPKKAKVQEAHAKFQEADAQMSEKRDEEETFKGPIKKLESEARKAANEATQARATARGHTQ